MEDISVKENRLFLMNTAAQDRHPATGASRHEALRVARADAKTGKDL